MKQKITFFKVFLTLMLLCGVSSVWAETITVGYGWETADDASKWVITGDSQQNKDAKKNGSFGCSINVNHFYVQFKDKVYVTEFGFSFTKTSTNNNYNVYIETSEDGENWTAVETYSMSSFTKGTWSDKSHVFDGSKQLYVRFHCYNTTAVRYLDDVYIKYSTTASTTPSISASNIDIDADATSGEIAYTIANPVSGKSLTAVTDAEWISNIAVTSEKVTFDATKNTGDARTAQITLKYDGADDKVVKVTQNHLVLDYVTLPFEWAGGASSLFANLDGVTVSGLGSDYAPSNAPYLIKLDGTGDYFQFKTNEPIGLMSVDVKMLGGATASSLKVQGSADGDNWSDIETLSISGKQNDVLNLKTTSIPDKSYRYVKFVFNKGSNVGVGAITINAPQTQNVDITPVGYATAFIPFNATISNEANDVKAYYVTVLGNNAQLNEIKGTIPANKGVVLKGSAGTVTFTESAGTLADVTDNKLIGTADKDGAIFAEDNTTYYILSIVDGKVGFYWDPNSNDGDAAICAQYKAVLAVLNTSAGAPSFFTFDDATAINGISNVKASGVRYNLNGQAVGEDYKGIVIVNGKKMFNK